MLTLGGSKLVTMTDGKLLHACGLRYNHLSIVYMQIFGLSKCCKEIYEQIPAGKSGAEASGNAKSKTKKDIDKQIFVIGEEGSPVTRHKLPDFDFTVHLDAGSHLYEAGVSGKIKAEMSVFFDKTVVLTFSLMIDGKVCRSTAPLTTDHLISLIALNMGGEHWSSDPDNEKTASNINLKSSPVTIRNLYVDENGEWLTQPVTLSGEGADENDEENVFSRACARYRKAILKYEPEVLSKYQDFAYVDVWEDVDNYDGSLQKMEREEDMITYILRECKKEMVGLMTLYPKEWPYRTEESFAEVCGKNIAIDTDDLILLNSSMCVVFGTYGRRAAGSPTNWADHLALREAYYVSWPEYMLILEMVLAKKYTVAAARDLLIRSAKIGKNISSARESIEKNAKVELVITQLLLHLDAVNYSKFMSHKVMFDRTIKRLEIEKDEAGLKEVMAKVSNSLSNLSKMRSLRQAEMFNIVLGGISIASLFQVIFSDIDIPFLEHLGYPWAKSAGLTLVSVAIFFVFAGIITLSIVAVQNGGHGVRQIIGKSVRKIRNIIHV